MEKTLPRDAYVSADWFDQERDRVFETQWFAVGRVEEIPMPGDHIVCDVVGESVIVTRLRDGSLTAYINLCRHRGSRLTNAVGKPVQPDIGPSGTFG